MTAKKPDFYEVLGVSKEEDTAEIKSAYTKIAMKWHPDRHAAKNEKERAEFLALDKNKKSAAIMAYIKRDDDLETIKNFYMLATEAEKVLKDAGLRRAYDRGGHAGLEKEQSGQGYSSGGASITDLLVDRPGKPVGEQMGLDELGKLFGGDSKPAAPRQATPAPNPEDAANSRLARMRARANGQTPPPPPPAPRPQQVQPPVRQAPAPQPPVQAPSATAPRQVFDDVRQDVRRTTEGLANPQVELSLDVLLEFREELEKITAAVDKQIVRAKNGGPRP